MLTITPSLILYCFDLALTKTFYEVLGLRFKVEQHGKGPKHYACEFGEFVFELYPVRNKKKPNPGRSDARTRLAFSVSEFEKVHATLKAMTPRVSEPRVYDDERKLRSALARDPDGREILLLEQEETPLQ